MKPKSTRNPSAPRLSNSTAKPVLTFVDADIVSGKDEIAREQLLSNLQRYQSDAVSPLWVNWLRHRADIRFVCLTTDLAEYNNFMLDVVRSVQYVRETRTLLSFGGRADIDALLDLEMEISTNSPTVAASVLIDVKPGMDRQCFQGLLDLPRHQEVRRVWLLNCYHSENADLMMLLLGKNVSALTGYVTSWVRTVPGVIDTEMDTVLDWRWMASPDDIVSLCEMFFAQMSEK